MAVAEAAVDIEYSEVLVAGRVARVEGDVIALVAVAKEGPCHIEIVESAVSS